MQGRASGWEARSVLASVLVAVLLATAAPVQAGTVTRRVEAPTAPRLAVEVSRVAFPDGTADSVAVAAPDDVDSLAMAATVAGNTPLRSPLLLTGGDAGELLAEAGRATGGPGAAGGPPTVWLAGTDDPGFAAAGYTDVRTVDAANLLQVLPGGNDGRVAVFASGDRLAASFAAAYGAAHGVPALPVASRADLGPVFTNVVTEVVAFGSVGVPLPAGSTSVVGDDPVAMSEAAWPLFVRERPDGIPHVRAVRPVSADGFGPEAAPAFLAGVLAAWVQDDGGLPALVLVDGRPPDDVASACKGTRPDAGSLCLVAAAAGDTVHVSLTGTAGGADLDNGGVPATLPATGSAHPLLAAGVLALVAALAAGAARRPNPSRTGKR